MLNSMKKEEKRNNYNVLLQSWTYVDNEWSVFKITNKQ